MGHDEVLESTGYMCGVGSAAACVAICGAVCVADTVSPVGDVVGANAVGALKHL